MARPSQTVVDASVVSKWFLRESDTDAALSLRSMHLNGEIRLVAPALLVYEVANALRYHPRIGSELAAAFMTDLFDAGIAFDEVSELSAIAAIHVAYGAGLSLYDATYLSLAERLDCSVITSDEFLLRAAGSRGRHLRDSVASPP